MLPKKRCHLRRQATRLEDFGSSAPLCFPSSLNQLDGALGNDSPTQDTKAGSCFLPSDYMHEDTEALVWESTLHKVTQLAELEGELHSPDLRVKAFFMLSLEPLPRPEFQLITLQAGSLFP